MAGIISTPQAQLVGFVRLREGIDDLARALLESASSVFGTVSLMTPDVGAAPELAFIRTASWLYSHYYEAGRVGVKFLMSRPAAKALPEIESHHQLVRALRTWSQHNIAPALADHDRATLKVCSNWFEERCDILLPSSDQHYRRALQALLREACIFVANLTAQVENIRVDEARSEICQQWEDRISRDWPAHRFHSIISTIANDMGRTTIDPIALFKRNESEVRKILQIANESNLEDAVRQCVERILLVEFSELLPITGRDIMDSLGVAPGKRVGELLKQARSIYEAGQCSREQLLDRLAPFVGNPQSDGS